MTKQDPQRGPAKQSRRAFLKASALGAAAVGTGALPLARGAHAAGGDTIRIGMIGCGGRCSGAAAEAMRSGKDVKLVAMFDVFEDRVKPRREALGKMFPDQVDVTDDRMFTAFDGYKHVIESADVVLIACASKFHPMYMEAAIRAGKHVFVEKPHAIDPPGVRRVQAACALAREKGVSVVSGLQSRYHAGWRETVARIHDGQMGDVVAIQAMFLRGPYVLVQRPEGMPETMYQFRNWYHFCWLSGDDVTQSLVHNVDRASWIMKEEMPKWAFGLGGRSSSFGEVYGDMFDHHTAVYEYASGARMYALCRTQFGCYDNASDIIMGTKGVCRLGACRIDGENPWRFEGQHNNPYQAEQDALIESVRKGQPVNSGDYMATSTMVAVLGQIACYTGKAVEWDAALGAGFQFGPPPEEANFDIEPPTRPDATGNYPLPMPGVTKLLG